MFNNSVTFRKHVLLKCVNIFNYWCCGMSYRASSSSTPACEEQCHHPYMFVKVLISGDISVHIYACFATFYALLKNIRMF